MWLALLAVLHLSQAQNDCLTHPSFRQPDPSDIKVFCGSERVELEVLLCPAYYNGYNESLMALNSQNRDECKGLMDWTVDPPVLRWTIGLRAISTCANVLTITREQGEGALADYSNLQYLNIEGMVNSIDTSGRDISYLQAILYKFSCCYPLLYLVEKNEMSIAAVSLAVQDKNGSFVSTLSMKLFADHTYTNALQIPNKGLELKTRVFVEVKASNLTNRFNVLLDRCYATPTPFAMSSTYYNLFIGCDRGDQTILHVNGLQQDARFSFEAFRFVQHENRTLSTFYIHCATRLCESSTCASLIQNCSSTTNRRRRRADDTESTSVSDEATVTSGPISTHAGNDTSVVCSEFLTLPDSASPSSTAQRTQENGAVLGIVIIIWIFGILYPDGFHQLSQL